MLDMQCKQKNQISVGNNSLRDPNLRSLAALKYRKTLSIFASTHPIHIFPGQGFKKMRPQRQVLFLQL